MSDETGFDVVVLDRGGQPVVAVRGEIDIAAADQLAACCDEALTRADRITVDLSSATFLDAAGLGVLVRARLAAIERGGEVVLRSPTDAVTRVLRLTGMDEVFLLTADGDAANQ